MDLKKDIESESVYILRRNTHIYNEYLNSNLAKNSDSPRTYATYRTAMLQFIVFLEENYNGIYLLSQEFVKRTIEILENYIVFCLKKGNNRQTVNNKLTAISSFFIWAVKREYLKSHPFQYRIDRLKITETDKRRKSYFLTMEEIIKVRIILSINKKFDIQDRLIWEIFLDSANRISAIHSLKLNQLDLEKGLFKNVIEKGNIVTDVVFFHDTEIVLKEWLEYREKHNINSEYLLLTYYKNEWKQMTQSTIRKRIKKMGEILGYNLYPHTLRKTSINQISKLIDLETASEFANHTDIKTTKNHYIEGRTTDDRKSAINVAKKKYGIQK